ncbi:MAG: HlyC/CorC family transporter, partial [Clostridia bacterium]|nr:HlyC/CorC family transporter [Clostridia bacterium]
ENESQLIRSAIEFTDISVEDILTPRVDIVAIPENASPEVIAQRFAESGYSRLPVYRDGIDDIIGVLHEKDFYRNRGRSPLRTLLQRPLYTMPSTRLSVMLKRFQQNKAHMAVVMDEYGGVLGLVTLEDILEELVGEIWDEHDEIIEEYRQLPDGSYLVSGGASLDDLLDRFHLKGEYESVTVSGWVQEELGEFPKEGDSFTCEDLRVTVT